MSLRMIKWWTLRIKYVRRTWIYDYACSAFWRSERVSWCQVKSNVSGQTRQSFLHTARTKTRNPSKPFSLDPHESQWPSLGIPAKPCAQMHSLHHLLPALMWKRMKAESTENEYEKWNRNDWNVTPDDAWWSVSHHFWPLSIHRSRDVPSVACEAMMKTSRTSPYSLKHSSSWALGSLCFRTHTVSENENFWTRGLSLLKNTRCIQHYSTFYMWCFRRLASL
jgi:hypothetical protein